MHIREILKRLMDERGENPNSLSKKSRVPQPTIFRILEGISLNPRHQNLALLAKALGVPETVFYDTNSREQSNHVSEKNPIPYEISALVEAVQRLTPDEAKKLLPVVVLISRKGNQGSARANINNVPLILDDSADNSMDNAA